MVHRDYRSLKSFDFVGKQHHWPYNFFLAADYQTFHMNLNISQYLPKNSKNLKMTKKYSSKWIYNPILSGQIIAYVIYYNLLVPSSILTSKLQCAEQAAIIQTQPLTDVFRIGVLKNFAIFTGKHLCWSLFLIKMQGFYTGNFIKNRLQYMCIPVNFAKF